MMTWHCDLCRKEWEVPDGTRAHFHRCIRQYEGEAPPRRRRLPLDREARGAFWRALLEEVGEDRTWRD